MPSLIDPVKVGTIWKSIERLSSPFGNPSLAGIWVVLTLNNQKRDVYLYLEVQPKLFFSIFLSFNIF